MDNLSRRHIIKLGAAGFVLAAPGRSWASPTEEKLSPALMSRARTALARHQGKLVQTDRIGIADFSRPSREPRLFVVDLLSGQTSAHLVAHGRGSDPDHTGWVQGFSNRPGSFASSSGAYATDEIYSGEHGRSMRLEGLDASNSNAFDRAIVVHGAWYVSPEIVGNTGKLGRSEGCFAVSANSLSAVLAQLGPGRLLYADKV